MDDKLRTIQAALDGIENWFEAMDRYGCDHVAGEVPRLRRAVAEASELIDEIRLPPKH